MGILSIPFLIFSKFNFLSYFSTNEKNMSYVSVFDILKIGVGPSSSHTLGPWVAARNFVQELSEMKALTITDKVTVKLYGSLSLTGKGHGTDIAAILGLLNSDPETVEMDVVNNYPKELETTKVLHLGGDHEIAFDPSIDIEFHSDKQLDYHPNGMEIFAYSNSECVLARTYFSVGGGFVVDQRDIDKTDEVGTEHEIPFNVYKAEHVKEACVQNDLQIWELALQNEIQLHNEDFVPNRLMKIWSEMRDCIYRGCHTGGELPGGLNVRRRAYDMYMQLSEGKYEQEDVGKWMRGFHDVTSDFTVMLRWISCFAMAVNEENANFSRVVTAPTNGASGVIPAVLAYYVAFSGKNPSDEEIQKFLLTAGVIGGLYKNGATISAAMGGCQAEIGVSSSMAAVALCERLGGSLDQCLMAGEIAMEHHLGLTCDPVKGLVQIPCIERNTMGAIKAITAAQLALTSNPEYAKVSLDNVISTMWETAQDMNHKYKETSLGGLATNISVVVPEC